MSNLTSVLSELGSCPDKIIRKSVSNVTCAEDYWRIRFFMTEKQLQEWPLIARLKTIYDSMIA